MTVDQALHFDQYPLPRVDDLFSSLAGGISFGKLDLSYAYQQVFLEEDAKQYVTINTHRGCLSTTGCYLVSRPLLQYSNDPWTAYYKEYNTPSFILRF